MTLALKRFELLGIHPAFLERHLTGVYNTLEESDIDAMFSFKRVWTSDVEVDERLLAFYRKINVQVETPANDDSSIEQLIRAAGLGEASESRKAITFIKSARLSILDPQGCRGLCAMNFPRSIKELKLKTKKFSDYKTLQRIFDRLSNVSWTFELEFDDAFFAFLEKCSEDPLKMERADLKREMHEFENKYLAMIYRTMKSIYKYG